MEGALGLLLLVVLFLTGGETTNGGNGNGDTPSKVPGRKRGPDGRGDVWRDEDDLPSLPGPADFDYAGNGIWIDGECQFVIEGDLFWPDDPRFVVAEEAPSVSETLNLRRDNTIVGFIDYLMNEEGEDDPIEIVWRILTEVSPMCADVDPDTQWGESMRIWFNDFLDRVTAHVEEATIGFGEAS